MPHDSERADAPSKWLSNASADLVIARIELAPGGLHEQLCFHAQQAAEKSLDSNTPVSRGALGSHLWLDLLWKHESGFQPALFFPSISPLQSDCVSGMITPQLTDVNREVYARFCGISAGHPSRMEWLRRIIGALPSPRGIGTEFSSSHDTFGHN